MKYFKILMTLFAVTVLFGFTTKSSAYKKRCGSPVIVTNNASSGLLIYYIEFIDYEGNLITLNTSILPGQSLQVGRSLLGSNTVKIHVDRSKGEYSGVIDLNVNSTLQYTENPNSTSSGPDGVQDYFQFWHDFVCTTTVEFILRDP